MDIRPLAEAVMETAGKIKNDNMSDQDFYKVQFTELRKSEFIKEDMDETVFMFALFKCRKFDKRRN